MPEANVNTEVVALLAPDSAVAEAYRTLRTNIMMREFDKPLSVINVTSANAQEGKTTTAVNLAAVYGQLGKRVLLIDLDLRLPSVHKKLGIKNLRGITDAVTKNSELNKTIIRYRNTFDVLLSGTRTPFTSEFIQSEALKNLLYQLRSEYDVIIIDCPPVNLVTDGVIASTYCDGTLICVASQEDEVRELQKAKESLENANANIIGVVLTKVQENSKKYKYDYGYTYGYGHKQAKAPKKGR